MTRHETQSETLPTNSKKVQFFSDKRNLACFDKCQTSSQTQTSCTSLLCARTVNHNQRNCAIFRSRRQTELVGISLRTRVTATPATYLKTRVLTLLFEPRQHGTSTTTPLLHVYASVRSVFAATLQSDFAVLLCSGTAMNALLSYQPFVSVCSLSQLQTLSNLTNANQMREKEKSWPLVFPSRYPRPLASTTNEFAFEFTVLRVAHHHQNNVFLG